MNDRDLHEAKSSIKEKIEVKNGMLHITKTTTTAFAALLVSLAAAALIWVPQASASELSIEDGVNQVIETACSYTLDQGDDLMRAQADMVGEDLAALTEQNAAAQVQPVHPAATGTAAAPAGPRTINVDGSVMGYVDYFDASTAPTSGAGLWMGSDSTTDGTWGYFIGHNPGDFWHVMDLANGDLVTVTDSAGASRTYHVVDTFTVPDTTYWEEIESRVSGYGESVILQTCCGDHATYRIVVADAD